MRTARRPTTDASQPIAVEGTITALQLGRKRGGARVNVFLDGQFAFSLQKEIAGLLRVGQALSEVKTAELLQQDERARALDSALGYLSYRPRSEREVRDRLISAGVAPPVVDATIARLKDLRLIDDEQFARFWIEQRQTHRPRGARLLRVELQRKGLDSSTTAEALEEAREGEDPVEAACRAAHRKSLGLRGLGEREFMQKLGQYLIRRGFDFETTRSACRRLWSEIQ